MRTIFTVTLFSLFLDIRMLLSVSKTRRNIQYLMMYADGRKKNAFQLALQTMYRVQFFFFICGLFTAKECIFTYVQTVISVFAIQPLNFL